MGARKLTAEQVLTARRLRAEGMQFKTLAAMFGITISGIRHAVDGRNWKHL